MISMKHELKRREGMIKKRRALFVEPSHKYDISELAKEFSGFGFSIKHSVELIKNIVK